MMLQLNKIDIIIIIITIIIIIMNNRKKIVLNRWGVQHHCTQNGHGVASLNNKNKNKKYYLIINNLKSSICIQLATAPPSLITICWCDGTKSGQVASHTYHSFME